MSICIALVFGTDCSFSKQMPSVRLFCIVQGSVILPDTHCIAAWQARSRSKHSCRCWSLDYSQGFWLS